MEDDYKTLCLTIGWSIVVYVAEKNLEPSIHSEEELGVGGRRLMYLSNESFIELLKVSRSFLKQGPMLSTETW